MKFPVLIFFITSLVKTGEGLLLIAAVNASLTSLFLSTGLELSSAPFGTISNNKTDTPIPAKWQAIREPITPLPRTATFLMERFMCLLINYLYLNFVKLVSYATIYRR